MKIKLGPVEIEQDGLKDEVLYNEYKESPKTVEKYLDEKSKYFDLTIKNLIAGQTLKTIKNFIVSVASWVFFVAWSIYVFWESKDAFVWNEFSLETIFGVLLQALLILGICFLPVVLVEGFFKLASVISGRKKPVTENQETPKAKTGKK